MSVKIALIKKQHKTVNFFENFIDEPPLSVHLNKELAWAFLSHGFKVTSV